MFRRLIPSMTLFLAVVGCASEITIPAADATPPTATLLAGASSPGTESTSVTSGGSDQAISLRQKTGKLNLLAIANDQESGIHLVEIWILTRTTVCDDSTCESSEPLVGAPQFAVSHPQRRVGETANDSEVLGNFLDLAKEIPQSPPAAGGSYTVVWTIYCRARNHLGGMTQTAKITMTFTERS